jgi:hypothetical protein
MRRKCQYVSLPRNISQLQVLFDYLKELQVAWPMIGLYFDVISAVIAWYTGTKFKYESKA